MIFKIGNEIVQIGKEWFIPHIGPLSNNFVYKMCLIFTKKFKIDFGNRKGNNPIRQWNWFSQILASGQNTNCFLFAPRGSKWIFKTINWNTQSGNWIISPTSRALNRNLLLQNVSHFTKDFKIIAKIGNRFLFTSAAR